MSSDEWMWWQDVPKEREDEIIEKMAQYTANHKLSEAMHLLFQMTSPLGRLGSDISLAVFGPYMDFFGTAEYLAVYRREGNVKRLLNRIEEILEERNKEVEQEKESEKSDKT